MLEADALQNVVQLDVDAQVVGVELELVAGLQAAVFVHVHGQRGDAAVNGSAANGDNRRRRVKGDERLLSCHVMHAVRISSYGQATPA